MNLEVDYLRKSVNIYYESWPNISANIPNKLPHKILTLKQDNTQIAKYVHIILPLRWNHLDFLKSEEKAEDSE